eukprot:TRINITY_DN476_c0_g1_i9.p1 TRINITY_DN476_c0_g1~~TRINITY_DN476_c0_g1_i9.p1  ORF type:complete len:565 (+),score=9.23 TRINITY_DN476_c0_g1_i9:81-1775(+)
MFSFVTLVVVLLPHLEAVKVSNCGNLNDIRYDTDCFFSKMDKVQTRHLDLFIFKNLLLFDGVLYYIVPRSFDKSRILVLQNTLMNIVNQEVDFQVRNVSRSPLTFGQAGRVYEINDVKEYRTAMIFQKQNQKKYLHRQVRMLETPYVDSRIVYNLLCYYFKQCEFDNEYRNSTLFFTTVWNQSRLDWHIGQGMDCFTNDYAFHAHHSVYFNQTLFVLRRAIVYRYHFNSKKQHPIAQIKGFNNFRNQCAQNGYNYVTNNKVTLQKPYNISICAMFRNEGRILLEWIAYHNIIGINHFYLYNHESEDEGLPVLEPLIQQGLVTITNISELPMISELILQDSVMRHCSDSFSRQSKWLISIDLDEFLVVKGKEYGGNLQRWIDMNPILTSNTGQIFMARDRFSGNDHTLNELQLITQQITRKQQGFFVKPLVNTNGLDRLTHHWAYTMQPSRTSNFGVECYLTQVMQNSSCYKYREVLIYHFENQSFDQCMKKINPQKWAYSWRRQRGEYHCQYQIFESQNNTEEDMWYEDTYLSNSDMTKNICERMNQLNRAWLASQRVCKNEDV